ncbi:MAG TPA: MmgE/PrpD family protein [Bryobacteraceae bacterium]|nr:MmgE/PrpD family protein [Bryobacteraceae bacterium]
MQTTRRTLLKSAAAVVTGVSVPLRFARAANPPSPVIVKLGNYMSEAAARALPDEVIEKTKHHILDTLAAMVSGTELPPGKVAQAMAKAHTGEKTATVVGTNILCGPIEAAMVNGMLAHSDETDDSHAPSQSHPGCSIVPATLAASEQFGTDGTRMIRAVALGYDIGTRVTMTLGALDFQLATHHSSHSIAGDFGSSAAAGCVAGLNAQQMRWILDYAGQQAAGVAAWQRDTDHIEKSLVFAGWPARNGVSAALLIQIGGTGVDDIMSGADNFLLAFNPKADPQGLIDKLGERYEITRTNIKKWTVGSPIQAPLDALEAMRKKHPFDADQVQKVVVRMATGDARTVNNREMPDISLQHMVSVMLLDKTASFAAAHDKPRMQDPAVLRQRAKVELISDVELDKLHPARVSIVEVTLADGTKLTERVEAVRGTAENPMTREEVVAKARELTTPILGADKSAKLIQKILALETVKDVRELRPLLQKV